ncbi:MAG: hypothetical protein QM703_28480 [Gemmatales bacterium]
MFARNLFDKYFVAGIFTTPLDAGCVEFDAALHDPAIRTSRRWNPQRTFGDQVERLI